MRARDADFYLIASGLVALEIVAPAIRFACKRSARVTSSAGRPY